MKIENKVALITGAAKRIGHALAMELARRGARIAIHYRASRAEAEQTLEAVRKQGSDGILLQAELTSSTDLERMFTEFDGHFNSLDILINNASVFSPSDPRHTSEQDWDGQMDANAKAPFFVAQHAARRMRQGKIINLADVAGEVVWPGYFAYSVSKAALIAVNRGLAKSLAPHIQVNSIAPGPVLFPDYYTDEQKQSAVERTLLKREGSAQDIVNTAIFLIENDYITGELIHVDGGRHIM
jgi:NAD(P)-dependent dehydrogenase (short-subunit alcohol dehydrogenase family)